VVASHEKVVMIITGLDVGGAETMLLNLLERLHVRFSPHVISLTTVGAIGEKIASLGIPVESLGMAPSMPNPQKVLHLAQRLRELRPYIVHTWMYHADLVGGLAARIARVPRVIWGIRNSDLNRESTKFTTRAVVRVCALASHVLPDRILSCSAVAKTVHVELGYSSRKMLVVPNGFDLRRFRPDPAARNSVRAELDLRDGAPLVGLIARYDQQKNHRGFFEMARPLHDAIPGVHFVLAGTNIEHSNQELVRFIQASGVERATHLLGPRNDIPRIMAALDVLVSCSSYGEAFPNVLGEAMACGIPCAVTDVGESAFIVGDTGSVVGRHDMAGLAAATAALLSTSAEARQIRERQARLRVADLFEIENVVRRYESVYDELH
jgi:glycosyltransferase involved in cell wall biosynthesis